MGGAQAPVRRLGAAWRGRHGNPRLASLPVQFVGTADGRCDVGAVKLLGSSVNVPRLEPDEEKDSRATPVADQRATRNPPGVSARLPAQPSSAATASCATATTVAVRIGEPRRLLAPRARMQLAERPGASL